MAIQGLVDNNDWTANERPQNWRAGISLLEINGSVPITALTSRMKKRVTDDPQFNWWEKAQQSRRIQITASLSASTSNIATTTTAGGGMKGLKKGDMLLIESTGEIVRVESDPSSDLGVTVSRGQAGSTAAALSVTTTAGLNPFMTVIGSAYAEGSNAPTPINFRPEQGYNYTQIFRNTYGMTNTASRTNLRTGNQAAENRRECLEIMSMDMERAFWWGKRAETSEDGAPLRYTGGIESYIDSGNIVSASGGSANMTNIEDWMEQAFRYGSSEKMAFTGNLGALAIQRVLRKNTSWEIRSGITEFGLKVTRIDSLFGSLVLYRHPLFNYSLGGTTGTTTYYGRNTYFYILDMAEFKYTYMTGRDVKHQTDLQNPGQDSKVSGYLGECGLEFGHPKKHFLIKDLATGVADS